VFYIDYTYILLKLFPLLDALVHIVVVILQLEIIVETTAAHAARVLLRLVALFAHVARQGAQDLVATSARLAHIRSTRRIR